MSSYEGVPCLSGQRLTASVVSIGPSFVGRLIVLINRFSPPETDIASDREDRGERRSAMRCTEGPNPTWAPLEIRADRFDNYRGGLSPLDRWLELLA